VCRLASAHGQRQVSVKLTRHATVAAAAGRHTATVTSRAPHTTRAIAEELPLLLAERELSLRTLATRLGLDHGFLSRAVRGTDGKVLTLELVSRIAAELHLAPDYFVEVREALVIERVKADSELRDRLYRTLTL
jgi:plasmid maintenance system antidote protein VapI